MLRNCPGRTLLLRSARPSGKRRIRKRIRAGLDTSPINILNHILCLLDKWRSRGRPGYFRLAKLRKRERYRADYRIVAQSLISHLDFDSALDVGCANGFLLSEFQNQDRTVRGIDLSPDLKEAVPDRLRPHVHTADFAESSGEWDLVSCVEMAEHIPAERSTELVDTLTRTARRWIYFSAAPPGQRGTGHINLRPHADWINWFAERGWTVDEQRTQAMREDMRAVQSAPWLRRNSFILSNGWKEGDRPI